MQGQLLKKIQENENLFEILVQKKLYRFLMKYRVLKKPSASYYLNYFKINFRLVKMFSKTNVNLFTQKTDDFVYNYCSLTFLPKQKVFARYKHLLAVLKISYLLQEFITFCKTISSQSRDQDALRWPEKKRFQ